MNSVSKTNNVLKDLSNEEIAIRIINGEKHLENYLIHRNINLVRKIAHKYKLPGVEFEDKVQDGLMGMHMSLKTYKPGVSKFSSHATYWIIAYILKEGANQSDTVRIPMNVVNYKVQMLQFTKDYIDEHGKRPTPETIAKGLCCSVALIKTIIMSNGAAQPMSLDAQQSNSTDSGEMSISEFVGGKTLESLVETSSQFEQIQKFIVELPEVDQIIVNKIMGLNGEKIHNFREIDKLVANEAGDAMGYCSINARYNTAITYIKGRIENRLKKMVLPISQKDIKKRDVVILINQGLKKAYLTSDLKYSQANAQKVRGMFLNNKETFGLCIQEGTVALQYEKDIAIRDVDLHLIQAIKDMESMGIEIINKQDFNFFDPLAK